MKKMRILFFLLLLCFTSAVIAQNKQITGNEYIFLIALLIESVSLFSNIPGTYGAFNTNWDSRSIRTFVLDKDMVSNLLATNNHKTDTYTWSKSIKGIQDMFPNFTQRYCLITIRI